MNDSSKSGSSSKFDIVLASTLLAAAVGFMLFRPRNAAPQPERDERRRIQAQSGVRIPALIAPLSSTIH